MAKENYYNETSNTVAGINTPKEREDASPLDMVDGAVEEMVDKLRDDFGGGDGNGRQRTGNDGKR